MINLRTSLAILLLQTAKHVQAQQCAATYSPATWLQNVVPEPDYDGMNQEVPCTSLEDTNCNCFPEGLVNWDGLCGRNLSRTCRRALYFNNSDGEWWPKSHGDKMTELWNQITGTNLHGLDDDFQVPAKVKCQNFDDMWKHFNNLPGASYTTFGDETPRQGGSASRLKHVHQQGIVGKGKFIPNAERVASEGYTGIFSSGADDVIIRFSEVGLHVDGLTGSVNPAAAFKFLRSGIHSANQFGMVAFENKPDQGWDWFAKDLLTHLPQFDDFDQHTCEVTRSDGTTRDVFDRTQTPSSECGPASIGRWLNQATTFIFVNGNFRLAEYDQDGNQSDNPHFPFQLKFVANPSLTTTDNSSRFYDQLIPGGRAQIDADTLLYTVYAMNSPGIEIPEDWFEIGTIETTSTFTQSLWGDERLFFQHGAQIDDFINLPDGFRQDHRINLHQPMYNEEKYGNWHNPSTFNISEPTESDYVIKGMYSTGCPFAFVLDQINAFGALNPDQVTDRGPVGG